MTNFLKILLTAVFIVFLSGVFAQTGSISGVVKDYDSGDRVPFASVTVVSENSGETIGGAVSNDKGRFKIDDLKNGNYKVVVSFIGYQTDTINAVLVEANKLHAHLGEIAISAASIELEGVEVRGNAKATSRKIDRQTYRAGDFETASGGTAVDVLNKLPSVSVDPDGTVSLRGTSDFMVYLNGKPTQMEASVLLNQIAASNIENIDVITVPTARYDAQGKGGIVNIETKKSGADGFSISSNGLLGGSPWGNKTDKYSGYKMKDDRYGAGLNMVYRKDDFALFGGVNYNYKNVNGLRVGDARLLQSNGSYYHMVADGERPEWYENYSANWGIDYKLSANSTVSASYYYGNRTEGRSAFYVYNNFYGDVEKNPIQGIDAENHWIYNPNTDDRFGKFHTANIDLIQKFDNKSQVKLSLLYEHSNLSRHLDNLDYDFDKPNDEPGQLLKHYQQTDATPLDGFRTSIEWEKELENEGKLGIGFQPQFVKQEGGYNYDTLNVNTGAWGTNNKFNNDVELSRAIYAGYIDYSGTFGKLNLVAGLRLEYTDQLLEIGNPDYVDIFERPQQTEYKVQQLDWFPTLHTQYGFNERHVLTFAASRRINRPPTKNMAPFLYRRHYEVYLVGDPELEPEYLTNFELSLDKKVGEQSFTLTGFYRGTDNAIFRVNTVYEEENVLIRSYTNSGNVQSLGAELNANLSAGQFAKFFIGGSLYNFNAQGEVFGYKEDNSSTNWSIKGNMNLFFTKEIKFTLDFDARSSTVTTQGENYNFWMSNTALNYTPEKLAGWDFSVKVLDIFGSNQTGLNTRAYNAQQQQIFYQEVEYDRYGPIVELGVTYSLNLNGKSKKNAGSIFGKGQF
ncbi:TonB-dependent receptor [uncultured Draconibacterium sp.]|uniref:TonB-dependent receptor domain-containing protein n=1 Tax=uncultured Draconibacterium sp. TaxID=1573823 RepID=UPI0025CD59B6|nr:TonB-dependent receptor [uncultured Draconibacterium sp.]